MFRKIKKLLIASYEIIYYSFLIKRVSGHVINDVFDCKYEKKKDLEIKAFIFSKFESECSLQEFTLNSHMKFDIFNFHHFVNNFTDNVDDIKIPWELGRLNFVTEQSIRSKSELTGILELISFKGISKVGYGVQWKCAMDVAIRSINLILMNDLYCGKNHGNSTYCKLMAGSLDYVILNLEKYGEWRGNHYLTNLVGILVVSSHFDSIKYNKMFDFALVELLIELDRQFLPDGTNFEGSTAYHHFGLELLSVVYTVLKKIDYSARRVHYSNPYLLTNLGVKKCFYDESLFANVILKLESKISKGLDFSIASLDCKGRLIQIGDNDSGKVFRTCYTESYNPEFYADIVYQISESLNTGKFQCRVENEKFYIDYVEALRESKLLPSKVFQDNEFENEYSKANIAAKRIYKFDIKDLSFPMSLEYFEDFGLVVARSKDSILTFRCGSIGQLGKGGHDHYDQLSITLTDSGERVIADPGVGCYTKDTSTRNRYRSSKAHFGLMSKGEADDYSNLFSISSTPSTLITIHGNKVLGKQVVNNVEKYRSIEFEQGIVIIKDLVVNGEILENFERIPYSPGYGIIENE